MDPNPSNLSRSISSTCLFVAAALAAAASLTPNSVDATPAYARRYDTKCETCHYPVPPRLNNTGMLFLRYGFRLPDADENGNLTVKTVPAHSIGDAGSLLAEFAGKWDQLVAPGESRSTLELGEVSLIAGTAVAEHFAAQSEFLLRSGEGAPELEFAEGRFNYGKPAHQLNVRAGLIQLQNWQKAIHGSITVSKPFVFSEEPFASVGDFGGLGLGTNQVGLEAGYTYTRLRNGKIMASMLSATVLNGVDESGVAASRNTTDGMDVYLQAIQLFGAENTLGAFYYKGRVLIDPTGLLSPPGPFRDHLTRYGLMGNYTVLDRVDVVAAAADGKDRSDQITGNVWNRSAFVQLDVRIRDRWVADYRRDYFDPDRSVGDDLIRAHTLSSTYQAADQLLLTVEYREVGESSARTHGYTGTFRFIY